MLDFFFFHFPFSRFRNALLIFIFQTERKQWNSRKCFFQENWSSWLRLGFKTFYWAIHWNNRFSGNFNSFLDSQETLEIGKFMMKPSYCWHIRWDPNYPKLNIYDTTFSDNFLLFWHHNELVLHQRTTWNYREFLFFGEQRKGKSKRKRKDTQIDI